MASLAPSVRVASHRGSLFRAYVASLPSSSTHCTHPPRWGDMCGRKDRWKIRSKSCQNLAQRWERIVPLFFFFFFFLSDRFGPGERIFTVQFSSAQPSTHFFLSQLLFSWFGPAECTYKLGDDPTNIGDLSKTWLSPTHGPVYLQNGFGLVRFLDRPPYLCNPTEHFSY